MLECMATLCVLAVVIVGMLTMTCVITIEEAGAALARVLGFFTLVLCAVCLVKKLFATVATVLGSLAFEILVLALIIVAVLLLGMVSFKFRSVVQRGSERSEEENYE